MTTYTKNMIFIPLIGILGVVLFLICQKRGEPALKSGYLPGAKALQFEQDSVLVDDRQVGLVNLERFTLLASRLGGEYFDANSIDNYSLHDDSVTFRLKRRKMSVFFSNFTNDVSWFERRYNNFPVQIHDGYSFTAAIVDSNGTKYMKIPYFLLTSLAEAVTENSMLETESQNDRVSYATISEQDIQTITKYQLGDGLIQTGGLVEQNLNAILQKENANNISDPMKRLEVVWNYLHRNWRLSGKNGKSISEKMSAYDLINKYYANNKKYEGDADEFMILMLSFGRQLGLKTEHGIANEDGNYGYLFAKFKVKEGDPWSYCYYHSSSFKAQKPKGVVIGESNFSN